MVATFLVEKSLITEIEPAVNELCKAMAITLDSVCEFTWGFGREYLIKVGTEYYVWSDPEFEGTNQIRPYKGNLQDITSQWLFGKHKGIHRIGDYCGGCVTFINCSDSATGQ